jgi:CoA:oxalate CoA-transferase
MSSAAGNAAKHDALAGIRVLDFTIVMSGPMCTRFLADAGAEVIKVEAPDGDMPRTRPPFRGGISTYFGSMNCGKHSIVLNLQTPEGVRVARELARIADVIVENFRPGVMKRLGLDYASIAAENPRVVYCSISGFGQDGPGASVPAYAPVIQAASGYELAHAAYQDEVGKPAASGIFIADVLGAIHATSAINLALFDRERTGMGQHIDVALMDAVIAMLIGEVQDAQFPGERTPVPYRPVRASDGFVMVAVATPRNFTSLFSAIGYPPGHSATDTLHNPAAGWNWAVISPWIEAWTLERTMSEVEAELGACGVPCSRYKTLAEALSDSQSVHRGIQVQVGEGEGRFAVANPPFRMSRADVHARDKLPRLGRDTERVLGEMLGYTSRHLEDLRQAGAIGGRPGE